MSKTIGYRKIYDFTSNPKELISKGKIEQYWLGENLKKIYLQKRVPAFDFKSNIDYIDQSFICKQYQLKGFEYGNWVTQEERLNFLVCGHIALFDLKKILGLKSIGFNSRLGIAFGARGSAGAIAHFEPDTFMINLTRLNGWQSLAHEYGHSLDYYFGGYVDQSRLHFALTCGGSEAKTVDITQYQKNSLRYAMNDLINSINTIVVSGKVQDSESRKQLVKSQGNAGYYFRRNEIFARFFEKYVMYRLSKLGIRNNFLSKEKYISSVYVTRADFARVLPKMEILINLMKKA